VRRAAACDARERRARYAAMEPETSLADEAHAEQGPIVSASTRLVPLTGPPRTRIHCMFAGREYFCGIERRLNASGTETFVKLNDVHKPERSGGHEICDEARR